MMHQTVLFLLSLVLLQYTFGCYITNCPIGGKRNLRVENDLQNHQCPTCGINGQCYGPTICCTHRGCRIGHPTDIRQCSTEDRDSIPCSIDADSCTAVPNGRCAANRVCCNSESCQIDKTCSMSFNTRIFHIN